MARVRRSPLWQHDDRHKPPRDRLLRTAVSLEHSHPLCESLHPAWSRPRFIALTTGATCTELEAIIAVDKQAIRFEQDKLEALAQYAKGTPDYEEQRQTVADIEAKIENQVKKLSKITTAKKCGVEEASVTSPFRTD